MYKNRIIPCLLRHRKGLVKTIQFKEHIYLGDPFNIARLFNEKEADELIILDIDATVNKQEPDYKFIEEFASECFMPVCYGGGIKSLEQIKRIFGYGIEKVALSSVLVENPSILKEAATIFGKQSIIAVIDVKKNLFGKYQVHINNGKINTKLDPVVFAKKLESLGAGEIVVNNIDLDGKCSGYDIKLMHKITSELTIPVVALGGAGSLNDMKNVVMQGGAAAAAAGSWFVFTGVHKAVLINYPQRDELNRLFNE